MGMAKTIASNRKEAEAEIKEVYGFVPDFFNAMPDEGFHVLWGLQRDIEDSENTKLDNKTKQLIGLAVAAQIKCQYCIYYHTRAAHAFGASQQELREAAAMSGVTAATSNVISGNLVDFDKFKRDIDRAIEYMVKNGR
jgi:AhpD family alkylhydroperoxidase